MNTSSTGKPANAYRVLHSADWHLGKMLGDKSREEEHQHFLTFLLDQIDQLSVDALIIAGDIFDSANPPQSAMKQYYNFLSELLQKKTCAVVMVAGNHDSPANLEAPRDLLRALGAHVVGTLPGECEELLVPLPNADVPQLVVAAMPYLRDRDLRVGQSGQDMRGIQQALIQGIKDRYEEIEKAAQCWKDCGVPVLVTGHLTVAGASKSESEREIHIGGLGAVESGCFPESFDYVALGHLHRPQMAGTEHIRYSGSPLPLSFSEANDEKEMRLLDFAEGKLISQSALLIPFTRRLMQLHCTRDTLETAMKDFAPAECTLPAWVEVTVKDAAPGDNLFETVQELARERKFEVIAVNRGPNVFTGSMSSGEEGCADVEKQLEDPKVVFAHRLEADERYTDEERKALEAAFAQLCELHAERERSGMEESTFSN